MKEKFQSMILAASDAVNTIRNSKDIIVISHIDADGLSSAGIMCRALVRAGIEHENMFFKQIDALAIESIANRNPELAIFTDLGSGMLIDIGKAGLNSVIIADHHKPDNSSIKVTCHINPHLWDLDGATTMSGSGAAYCIALAMDKTNIDLADLTIVGAVGDLQDLAYNHLLGLNREILGLGQEAGVIEVKQDLKFFGRQTRPIYKMLQYSQDPYIPGISGDEWGCIQFLRSIGVRQPDGRWKPLAESYRLRWIDLPKAEKKCLIEKLRIRGEKEGVPKDRLDRIIGETYTLLKEEEGTELRDASEFATLLNATARYDRAEVGLAVCMGDRIDMFTEARNLLRGHRKNLADGIKFVDECGVIPMAHIQYFDAGDRILDTIVGIVAGMCFQIADRSKPILAFAKVNDKELKVSARGTQELVSHGLDLSSAITMASTAVGGRGGGHNVAAGATIPNGKKDEFLKLIDEIIGKQLSDSL